MLKSSLRHAARTCQCSHSTPTRPGVPSPIRASFSSRSHQRRQSSSKPPIPPGDGPRNITASSIKVVGTPRTKEATAPTKDGKEPPASGDGRIPKRKLARSKSEGKQDGGNEWTLNLPSVPSTQHLDPKDLNVAAFFATHRPISVSSAIPATAPLNFVDQMFELKRQLPRQRLGPEEVIFTLASAVKGLEGTIAQQQQHDSSGTTQKVDLIQALTRHNDQQPEDSSQIQHLDGQPSVRINGDSIKIIMQEVVRHFRPYNTPPAPTPISDAELEAREAEQAAAEANEELQAKELEAQIQQQDNESRAPNLRQVIMTVQEQGDLLQGRKFFASKAPRIRIQDPQELDDVQEQREPQQVGRRKRGGYLEQRVRDPYRVRYWAISVKRQRRLKMKKHKYKKLMRKTRNLRRRLDKL